MCGCLFLGSKETCTFQDYIYSHVFPRQTGRVFFGKDPDLFSVNCDGTVIVCHSMALITALYAVIFEQMRQHPRLCEIVDSDDLNGIVSKKLPERKPSYPSESVYSDLCH